MKTEYQKAKAKRRAALIRRYTRNILKVYSQATETEIKDGLRWYNDAYRLAVQYGDLYGIDSLTASYMLAALSPNNGWQGNILDFCKVASVSKQRLEFAVKNFESGAKTGFRFIACQTYSLNCYKAAKILLTKDYSLLKGNKVTAFQDNIYHAKSDRVTIDFHAISAALGTRLTADKAKASFYNSPNYQIFEAGYKKAAETLGLQPKDLQAVVWLVWRRLHGISNQHNYNAETIGKNWHASKEKDGNK